jgi:hypothetical protein
MSRIVKNAVANGRAGQSANNRSKTAKGIQSDPAPRPKSKHDLILSLLRRKQGASLEEMQTASGWQAHSVRGFLSGTVKKRLRLKLQLSKTKDGNRRYAIAG